MSPIPNVRRTTISTQHTLNGVNTEQLSQTIRAVQENTALGKCEFRAKNHLSGGGQNCTTVKDFYGAGQENSRAAAFQFKADEPPVLLGHAAAREVQV